MEAALVTTINNFITLGVRIGLAAFVLFILLAGGQLMASGGSTKGQEAAKNSALFAVLGLVVILLCRLIGAAIIGAIPQPA